jgi:LuxR family maltose regulon positive regulatory protein
LLASPQPAPIESLLTLLLNDLAALSDPLVLVLDDYHVIENRAIHDGLAFLLDHLPPRLRLILATRSDPPLPLSRLRARQQLLELRASNLRFTPDEAAQFLNHVMQLNLTADDIAALDARTRVGSLACSWPRSRCRADRIRTSSFALSRAVIALCWSI